MRTCTEQQFLKDVSAHQMDIVHDTGVHRSVNFQIPKTFNHAFTITTWPGYLCISGDMGCYVFSRLTDMFQFFRTDQHEGKASLFINLGYWAEKLTAVDKNGKVKEYDSDKAKQRVIDWVNEWEAHPDVMKEVERLVLGYLDEGEEALRQHAQMFQSGPYSFRDFWEVDLTEYRYHFVWCCYAIAWGIQQFDKAKAAQAAQAIEVMP